MNYKELYAVKCVHFYLFNLVNLYICVINFAVNILIEVRIEWALWKHGHTKN